MTIASGTEIALVLSGGNALGAYQAGALATLAERGIEAGQVVGASIGAINGAIWCGNAPAARIGRLRDFWGPGGAAEAWPAADAMRRSLAAMGALTAGVPGRFVPRLGWGGEGSLYDLTPIDATLRRLIDFDRLAAAAPPLAVTAVDLETGEEVVLDAARERLAPIHLRASAALVPAFVPVEVGGRLLGDAGLAANLPLDGVLAAEGTAPLLCIAIDLLPLAAPQPQGLGELASRAQDLIFAAQSRRTIAAWQAIFAERQRLGTARPVTLIHLAYADQRREVAGKAFDFSALSVAERWRAGEAAMTRALDECDAVTLDAPGLAVWRLGAAGLERVEWELAPGPL